MFGGHEGRTVRAHEDNSSFDDRPFHEIIVQFHCVHISPESIIRVRDARVLFPRTKLIVTFASREKLNISKNIQDLYVPVHFRTYVRIYLFMYLWRKVVIDARGVRRKTCISKNVSLLKVSITGLWDFHNNSDDGT